MPRLFTALEIPYSVADSLARLRGGLSGARWIDAENYHITLRFIGDVDERVAHDVAHALDSIRRPAFTVTLDQLGSFGGDKPKAIIARAKPEPALLELQAEQERLLRRLGAPPEPRKFIPHVTLARLRGAAPRAVASYLGARGYFPPLKFEASRFVLFSSRDSVGGGPYVLEADYPFLSAQPAANGASADYGTPGAPVSKRSIETFERDEIWPD
jgi:RNA 2',3'-cyclic 3'-phosphodiesterase